MGWVVADGQKPPSGALGETENYRLQRYTVLVSSSNMGTEGWLREWHKHVGLSLLASPFSWSEVVLAAIMDRQSSEVYQSWDEDVSLAAERLLGQAGRTLAPASPVPRAWRRAAAHY